MDAVTRQTGQHIEFEMEWEGGFTLQLKLEDTIQAMIIWCASDVSMANFTLYTALGCKCRVKPLNYQVKVTLILVHV